MNTTTETPQSPLSDQTMVTRLMGKGLPILTLGWKGSGKSTLLSYCTQGKMPYTLLHHLSLEQSIPRTIPITITDFQGIPAQTLYISGGLRPLSLPFIHEDHFLGNFIYEALAMQKKKPLEASQWNRCFAAVTKDSPLLNHMELSPYWDSVENALGHLNQTHLLVLLSQVELDKESLDVRQNGVKKVFTKKLTQIIKGQHPFPQANNLQAFHSVFWSAALSYVNAPLTQLCEDFASSPLVWMNQNQTEFFITLEEANLDKCSPLEKIANLCLHPNYASVQKFIHPINILCRGDQRLFPETQGQENSVALWKEGEKETPIHAYTFIDTTGIAPTRPNDTLLGVKNMVDMAKQYKSEHILLAIHGDKPEQDHFICDFLRKLEVNCQIHFVYTHWDTHLISLGHTMKADFPQAKYFPEQDLSKGHQNKDQIIYNQAQTHEKAQQQAREEAFQQAMNDQSYFLGLGKKNNRTLTSRSYLLGQPSPFIPQETAQHCSIPQFLCALGSDLSEKKAKKHLVSGKKVRHSLEDPSAFLTPLLHREKEFDHLNLVKHLDLAFHGCFWMNDEDSNRGCLEKLLEGWVYGVGEGMRINHLAVLLEDVELFATKALCNPTWSGKSAQLFTSAFTPEDSNEKEQAKLQEHLFQFVSKGIGSIFLSTLCNHLYYNNHLPLHKHGDAHVLTTVNLLQALRFHCFPSVSSRMTPTVTYCLEQALLTCMQQYMDGYCVTIYEKE